MRSERSFVALLANEFAIFSNREIQGLYIWFLAGKDLSSSSAVDLILFFGCWFDCSTFFCC